MFLKCVPEVREWDSLTKNRSIGENPRNRCYLCSRATSHTCGYNPTWFWELRNWSPHTCRLWKRFCWLPAIFCCPFVFSGKEVPACSFIIQWIVNEHLVWPVIMLVLGQSRQKLNMVSALTELHYYINTHIHPNFLKSKRLIFCASITSLASVLRSNTVWIGSVLWLMLEFKVDVNCSVKLDWHRCLDLCKWIQFCVLWMQLDDQPVL